MTQLKNSSPCQSLLLQYYIRQCSSTNQNQTTLIRITDGHLYKKNSFLEKEERTPWFNHIIFPLTSNDDITIVLPSLSSLSAVIKPIPILFISPSSFNILRDIPICHSRAFPSRQVNYSTYPSVPHSPLALPWPQCNLSVSSQPRSSRQGLVKYNFWCLSNWEQKIIPVIMRCTRRQWSSLAISYFSGWNGCNDQRIWTWSQRSPWVLSKKFKDAFFVLYPLHTHHPQHHHLVTMQLGNCFECAVKDSGARQCQGFYREIWNS